MDSELWDSGKKRKKLLSFIELETEQPTQDTPMDENEAHEMLE
jgi:hypothetical protein